MLELPIIEKSIFIFVLIIYLAATIVGILQLSKDQEKYRRLLISLIALAVSLESVILVFRAVSLKAIPLTGLFESMIVLTLVFGLTYLFLSTVIRQVWFGSIMAWTISAITFLTAIVAQPASQLIPAAKTPWTIAHAVSMTLAGAAITFAAVMAYLFLMARRRLKSRQIVKLIGKLPNIEKLERLNLFGLIACFVLLSFGIVSGMGMASMSSSELRINPIDAKIILNGVAWVLIGIILLLRSTASIKGRKTAYMTMIVVFFILFAIVGTAIFCSTEHSFTVPATEHIQTEDL